MDKVKDLVNDLGIEGYGEYDGEQFIINIEDSDSFSSIYDMFSNEFGDAEETKADSDSYTSTLTDGEVEVVCEANYIKDSYSIVIRVR